MQQTVNSLFSIGGDKSITNVTTLPSRFVPYFEISARAALSKYRCVIVFILMNESKKPMNEPSN